MKEKIKLLKTAFLAVLLFVVLSLQGCSILLPAHSNSYDVTDEKVTLRMIKKGGLCTIQNKLNSNASVGSDKVLIGINGDACITRDEFAFAAPLAVAAAGLAFDFMQKRIEEEATHYEAQFGDRIAVQRFWTMESNTTESTVAIQPQPYYEGFEIIRGTRDHPFKDESSRPAFRMIFAFDTSSDGSAFLIRPTYVFHKSAKAKVLSKASIVSWFNWFAKATGNVEVKVDIDIDAIWIDEKKKTHFEKIAAFPVSIGAINLSSPTEFSTKDLSKKIAGWFPGVPCSSKVKMENEGDNCGNFWIKVLVTEKDPSNAKKYLKQSAELVGSKKETIINVINDKFGDE